ncbi:hypothetical protein LTR94_030586, partial [Friedmanniomyces endolithicus]
GRRIGRLWHAGRPDRVARRDRAVPRRADRRAASLYRAADAGAVDRADAGGTGRRAAPRRFPPVPADRIARGAGGARRADARRAARRIAGGQFVAGRRDEGQFRAAARTCARRGDD